MGPHQPRTTPAAGSERAAWKLLTTHRLRSRGPWGDSGHRTAETMFCLLGKTNRLLLTKQKVPVGKEVRRGTCAWTG